MAPSTPESPLAPPQASTKRGTSMVNLGAFQTSRNLARAKPIARRVSEISWSANARTESASLLTFSVARSSTQLHRRHSEGLARPEKRHACPRTGRDRPGADQRRREERRHFLQEWRCCRSGLRCRTVWRCRRRRWTVMLALQPKRVAIPGGELELFAQCLSPGYVPSSSRLRKYCCVSSSTQWM